MSSIKIFYWPDTLVTAAIIEDRPHLFAETDNFIVPMTQLLPSGSYLTYYTFPAKGTYMDFLELGDMVFLFEDVLYLCPMFTNGRLPHPEEEECMAQLVLQHYGARRHDRSAGVSVEILYTNKWCYAESYEMARAESLQEGL
ncbi:hypothetical protein AYJ82_002856 [Escherichia coli]|uniref:hypothetical protein n=1 Tax=Escherichia coli TaxID=562 RepID=UPI0010DD75EF|nr:hypothetical protein [Escherichia coli]EHQ5435634.1 hypothetical protein [Escherichia coli O168]EHY1477329.1 hypothetical protein [Escherichia coli O157]EFI6970363.1 hypothetical protein [Escherichia coli]EFJ8087143.1 hypothetical protein [Escherichia coli]EFL0646118.1 hypothetical protein [Escherichia coli]